MILRPVREMTGQSSEKCLEAGGITIPLERFAGTGKRENGEAAKSDEVGDQGTCNPQVPGRR